MAEEGVDAGLVAGAGAFEPGEDVGVEADGDGGFDGAVELADDGFGPIGDFGDVGGVDGFVGETEEGFEIGGGGFEAGEDFCFAARGFLGRNNLETSRQQIGLVKTIPQGLKPHFLHAYIVGAKAPTPMMHLSDG